MRSMEIPELNEVTLNFNYGDGLSEAQYLAFCEANPGLRCERTAEGEVIVAPPAGGDGSFRSERLWANCANGTGNKVRAAPSIPASNFCCRMDLRCHRCLLGLEREPRRPEPGA